MNRNKDKTEQLKEALYNEGKRVVDYQWDKVGNRIQVNDNWLNQPTTYQANDLNHYTSINQQVPSYDANGNLTQQNGKTYSYDSDNKLITAQSITANLTINYDAKRRPVSRTSNGETTYLIYDNWNLIAEYNGEGQLVASYISGADIDELISRIDEETDQTIYYQQDSLGNVVHLTNQKGQVLESYQYDAFGQPTVFNSKGQPIKVSSWRNRFLFTGREWIKEVGLYDYRNRAYSPELGRLLQTDPIGFKAQDMNLYRYVFNNPINWIDPTGETCSQNKDCTNRDGYMAPLYQIKYGGNMTACVDGESFSGFGGYFAAAIGAVAGSAVTGGPWGGVAGGAIGAGLYGMGKCGNCVCSADY